MSIKTSLEIQEYQDIIANGNSRLDLSQLDESILNSLTSRNFQEGSLLSEEYIGEFLTAVGYALAYKQSQPEKVGFEKACYDFANLTPPQQEVVLKQILEAFGKEDANLLAVALLNPRYL